MKSTYVLAIVLGAISIPATAADLVIPQTYSPALMAPETAYDWSGLYVGAAVGYGVASSNSAAGDRDSLGGALIAGYNYDFGTWVGGVRADFIPSGLTDIRVNTRTLGHAGRLVGTAGFKLGDEGKTLAYGLAGLGIAQSTRGNQEFLDLGFTAGVGVSHAVTDNVSVFGEVNYARFDDVADTTIDVNGVGAAVGVAYHF